MKTGNNSIISNLQASSVGGLVLLLMLAGAVNIVAAPKIVTNFPIPSSSSWQGADDPSLHGVYGDMIEALLRWRVSDNEYRVIFGDLHAETVTAETLAQRKKLLLD